MFLLRLFIYCIVGVSVKGTGVVIPEGECTSSEDCQKNPWTTPYPSCNNGQCQCSDGTCMIYTYTAVGNTYSFYCGTCGVIGSQCNETIECDQTDCTMADNFCHCEQGRVYRELCVLYTPISTSPTSVILIVILVGLLVILRLIKSRKRLKALCCKQCSSTESNQTTAVGINPNSGEKSAAYTISNSDFMVTASDNDLEWALQLSRQMENRNEDWLSMGSLTWSSASTTSTRPPSINHNRYQATLEAISEPGPSGHSDNSPSGVEENTPTVSSPHTRLRVSSRSTRSSVIPPISTSRSRPTTISQNTGGSISSRSSSQSTGVLPARSASLRSSTDEPQSISDTESLTIRIRSLRSATTTTSSRSSTRSYRSTVSTVSAPPIVYSSLSSNASSLIRFLSSNSFQRTNRSSISSRADDYPPASQRQYSSSPQLDTISTGSSYDASESSVRTNSVSSSIVRFTTDLGDPIL